MAGADVCALPLHLMLLGRRRHWDAVLTPAGRGTGHSNNVIPSVLGSRMVSKRWVLQGQLLFQVSVQKQKKAA